MSEKRFVWKCDDENCCIFDTKEEKAYFNVEVVGVLNEQETRIGLLEKGILDCLFEDKSIGMFALEMGLVDNG